MKWPRGYWVAVVGRFDATLSSLSFAKQFVERRIGYINSVIVQPLTGRTYVGRGSWELERRKNKRPRSVWRVRWEVLRRRVRMVQVRT